jgi:Flp pilus assembly protein protease CpaA
MHNKIKAMLATLGVIVGGSTAVYMFLMYTRIFLGLIMFIILLFGARELYHSLVGHYDEMDRLRNKNNKQQ